MDTVDAAFAFENRLEVERGHRTAEEAYRGKEDIAIVEVWK